MEKLLNIDEMYTDHYIKKKTGKYRHIQAPSNELKREQYKILKILKTYNFPIHESASGFCDGKSIITNAQCHINKECLLCIDLKDFFDTFTDNVIFNYLKNRKIKHAKYISRVLTRKGRLVQGAPSSPYITNLLFNRHDKKLNSIAKHNNLMYTRYADDMTFSGKYEDIKKCKKEIFNYIINNGFNISWEKVELQFSNKRQKVTGIVVNEKPNIQYSIANKIRAICHCIKRDVSNGTITNISEIENLYGETYEGLFGYVNFMSTVNPKFNKYRKELKDAYDILKTRRD